MQENKSKFLKYRKLIIILLFFVVLPLFVLGVVAISYRLESNRFVAKIKDNEVKLKRSSFKKFVLGSADHYQFDKLQINAKSRYVYYGSEQDKKDKYDPVGYGARISVKADIKDGQGLDDDKYKTYIYAAIVDPNAKEPIKFEQAILPHNNPDVEMLGYRTLKLKKNLPHKMPFVGKIKDCYVYVLIKVPYEKQDEADALMLAENLNETNNKVEKLVKYKNFMYKINVDAEITKDKYTHELWK